MRRSKDNYYRAALDLLAEGGVDSLTIAHLCARLGVTTGSFYAHFVGIREFHVAFLEQWEAGRVYLLKEQVDCATDSLDRIDDDFVDLTELSSDALTSKDLFAVLERLEKDRASATGTAARGAQSGRPPARTGGDRRQGCLRGDRAIAHHPRRGRAAHRRGAGFGSAPSDHRTTVAAAAFGYQGDHRAGDIGGSHVAVIRRFFAQLP